MSDSDPRHCASCGAEKSPYNRLCWLCRADQEEPQSAPRPPEGKADDVKGEPGHKQHEPHAATLRTSSILVLVVCVLLILGAFISEPGTGLLLALFMVPAAVGIAMAHTELKSEGGRVATASLVLAVVMAGVVAGGIAAAAALGALFLICASGVGSLAATGLETLLMPIGIAALAAGIYMGSRLARRIVLSGSRFEQGRR